MEPIKTEEKRNNDGTFAEGTAPGPGRPKGKTLKEFARLYLMTLPDDEKMKYLSELPKDVVWKMAEGMPKQDTETKLGIDSAQPILIQFIHGGTQDNTDTDRV